MKKAKFILKKKLKDKHGVYLADTDEKTGVIRINTGAKAHKDKAELASTVKHELLHLRHPNMTEKQVYKRTAKTKIPYAEQQKLLSKIRNKRMNYKMGAQKRKLKIKWGTKVEPGDIIKGANANTRKRVAIMGMV